MVVCFSVSAYPFVWNVVGPWICPEHWQLEFSNSLRLQEGKQGRQILYLPNYPTHQVKLCVCVGGQAGIFINVMRTKNR